MKGAVVLAILIFVTSSTAVVRYDGYQVIRLSIGNETEYHMVNDIAEKHLLDIWATNAVEGWMDVMITPAQAVETSAIFYPFSHFVRIPNVQDEIEISNKQKTLSPAALEASPFDGPIFDDYQEYSSITNWMNQQGSTHGAGVAQVFIISKTHLGANIYALDLGNRPLNKPTIYIQCGIHAREWIAPSTCLWIIDQILNVDDGTLLSRFRWVVVPVLNVDGYAYTGSDRLWRKNRQPNSGSTCVGTDLNRNYGYMWGGPGSSNSPCSETYRGSAAFSGPEIAGTRDFLNTLGTGRLVSFYDIHAYGAYFMSAWGYTCQTYPPDYDRMDALMRVGAAAIRPINNRNYVFGDSCNTIYQTSGGSNDWSYATGPRTVHSYCIEAFGTSFTPPTSWIRPMGAEIYAGIRAASLTL